MNPIHLGTASGRDFRLPLELVTQSIAILAKRGVGKTYTAAVLCEEIHDAGVPPIVIDPTGAHWGLKASADGKSPGLPFVVFGGEHADLPLESDAGEVIARAIVEQRFPAIIDLSLFRKGEMHRFMTAFLETLYRANRLAVHLVCDEADVYAPQKPFGEEARTLGAMQDIVRRGRIKGIGCTLITQRPQVLNKDVLTQCEVLVTLRLVHPKDIRAIEEWVAVHGDQDAAAKLIASLPSLPVGNAWFWAPAFGDIFERVQVRQRRTFDSSATPKPGEVRVSPQKFAEVDLSKLGKELEASAQRAKENDPAHLKAEIARLRALPVAPSHEMLEAARNEGFAECKRRVVEAQTKIAGELATIKANVDALSEYVNAITTPGGSLMPVQYIERRPVLAPRHELPIGCASRPAKLKATGSGVVMPKAERLILTCLAQLGPCTKNRVAAVTGYAVTGGGFNNALSALRAKGRITNGDPMDVNPEGISALGPYDPLPTGRDLVLHWERELGKAEAAIFRWVCAAYPKAMTKEDIAAATGYEPNGGGFNNALSRLRTLELITRGSDIRASDNLFA